MKVSSSERLSDFHKIFITIKIFDSMKLNMKITTNIRYEHLVDYQALKQQRVGKNAHPRTVNEVIIRVLSVTDRVRNLELTII